MNVAMGTVKYSTPYYVMITFIKFTYLIPEDVHPGDSKAIGLTCTLCIMVCIMDAAPILN